MIWPPVGHPSHPIAGPPGRPTHPIEQPDAGQPAHPIALPPQTFVVLAGIPGYGWRYVVVDPSLTPGTLPSETPEPK
jgi:hypothetical protein